jgi:Class III cytochrome C family
MKKRPLALALLMVGALLFVTAGVLTAAQKIPDVIIIENKYKDDKKGPVKYSHKKHEEEYKVACTECHHDYKDGKNVWKDTDPVKKCSECHDPEKKQGNADKLNLAFHKNCQGCHKELKDKKGPYKNCNDCHQKK